MGQCSVLVVDDDEEFVCTLAKRLRKRSLIVRTATSGGIALKSMKEEVPHVMLLDLNMAEMDGIEILERVKQEHPCVQVLIVTGEGSGKKAKAALNLGAYACLEKPVPMQEVFSAIKAAYLQRTDNETRGQR